MVREIQRDNPPPPLSVSSRCGGRLSDPEDGIRGSNLAITSEHQAFVETEGPYLLVYNHNTNATLQVIFKK
jgi:hypothetical protein